MHNPVVIALALIGVGMVFLMLKEGLSRKVDIFSARNMYFVGFIVYQIISPAVALHTENFTIFKVYSPSDTGKKFLMMVVFYLAVFIFSYRRVKFTPWIARKFTLPPREMSDYLLLGLAVFLIASGMFLRFTPFAVLAGPATQVSIAFAAIASAISGWVWSNRRSNIPVVLTAAGVVFGCLVIVLTGVFGRRPLLVVAMGFAWGVYHRRARLMSPARMMVYTAPFVIVAAVAVAAFTAMRSHESRNLDMQGTVSGMAKADIQSGMKDLLGGQTVGSATLWAIEQWPDRFERRYLYSFKYMGMLVVPRFMWPDKPTPLGNDVASLAQVEGINRKGITLPPGIIGYSVAEGGYVALFFYALFFGQFMRLIDELVRLNPTNAFIILPAAVATGQAFGLARGCIALFTDVLVLGFIATYLILFICDRLFGRKSTQVHYSPMPQLR